MTAATQTQERRRDLGETLEALKEQRQKTLLCYCSLVSTNTPGKTSPDGIQDIAPVALQELLNIMVDYMAMGHFTVYQRIIEGKERRGAVQEAAEIAYPGIGETTDVMVEFNDTYENFTGSAEEQKQIREDLSKLGEMLAIRGELEDEILNALLG